jgi:hypothetical protein
MRIAGHGIEIDLPDGWEGRIYRRPEGRPILHAASFALPAEDGDFGTSAVAGMPSNGVFIALAEYDPDALGEPLFAHQGLPLPLRATDTHPRALQRLGPGRAGVQRFFTSRSRPFGLYVVIRSEPVQAGQIDQANLVLGSLRITAPGGPNGP